MEKAKEILRLAYEKKLSQREIAQAVGCSPGNVNLILAKVKEAGVEDPLKLDTKVLGSIIYPPAAGAQTARPEPDLPRINEQLKLKGVTLFLLWEEYKRDHPDGIMYSQFCERVRDYQKQLDVFMRKTYKAGGQMMVDWAGLTMRYTGRDGKAVKVYLFVASLPATGIIFTDCFEDMGERSWVEANIRAFEYFGGAARLLVPDNTKTAVVKASYYDPQTNKTYHEMARYYGAAIVPARSRKPRDKAPVEKSVQIVEMRIIAKLRDTQFLSLGEVRDAVKAGLETVNNAPFQKMAESRRELFEKLEKHELIKLPAQRYEMAVFKLAKAAFDYHVQFDGHYYSVPYGYAGKQVQIRATQAAIEVLCDGERIACHQRCYAACKRYITNEEHMPEKHRAMADWTPERFRAWAAKTGKNTEAFISRLMEQREQPEQAFKTCAGILRLASTVSPAQMEAACSLALQKRVYSYKYFALLLKEESQQELALAEPTPIAHGNIRGAAYYGGGNA
jgi:transposase